MAGQDKVTEQTGWPEWEEYPDFTELVYRPLYIDDIAGTLNRAAADLADLDARQRDDFERFSRRAKHILALLLEALENYCRARSLAEYCFQLNRSDAYFAAERDRYRTERSQLNDLMREIYQAILRHDDLLLELADESGKMPLFHVQNQMAINRHLVNPEQELENKLVARLQETGYMFKDMPLLYYEHRPRQSEVSKTGEGQLTDSTQDEANPLLHRLERVGKPLPLVEDVNPLLDKLLTVREDLAGDQGFSGFVGLGYRRLGYFGFDQDDALKLHQLVVDYVVPLAADLRYLKERDDQSDRRQGDLFYASSLPYQHRIKNRGLHVSTALKLHPYLDDPRYRKPGRLKETRQADRLFNDALVSSLGGHTPDFWLKLREKGYIQIYNRPGQALRSKCYRLFTPPFPALYSNRLLQPETLGDYFNMAGRAYGYLCCSDAYNPFTYLDPGLANVRIWGRGMEFLSYFGADLLFETVEDADRWRFCHMANSILEIPLLALLDAFQHRLYMESGDIAGGSGSPDTVGLAVLAESPDLSIARKDRIWLEEVARFFPDLAADHSWLERQSGKWAAIRSTYTEPFSPLSKLMAMLTGIGLWRRALDRRSRAVLAFENFCTMTNDDMLLEILNKARLPNPFSKASLKKSMYKVSAFLDEGNSLS